MTVGLTFVVLEPQCHFPGNLLKGIYQNSLRKQRVFVHSERALRWRVGVKLSSQSAGALLHLLLPAKLFPAFSNYIQFSWKPVALYTP